MKDSNCIEEINNLEDLNKAIYFLKKGFRWSRSYSENLIKSIIINNGENNLFGFVLKDNKKQICGAILTINQGSLEINNRKILIINLSSWYILTEHRGYKSILMIKKIVNKLSEYIITNLTPSKSTISIIRAIGFKRLKTCTKNFYINKFFFRFLYFVNSKKSISLIKKNNLNSTSLNNFNLRDSEYITLKVNGTDLTLLITKTLIERNFFLINFKIPRLNLLWASDINFFKKNFKSILTFLFLNYKVLVVSSHFTDAYFFKNKKIWREHFYKSPIEIGNKSLLAGSELGIRY